MMLDKYAYVTTVLLMMTGVLIYLGLTVSFEAVYLAVAALAILALLSIWWSTVRRSKSR
ncbi:MAG TPA: hypothetical protein VGR53_02465 [Nitrososphaerales archaeon]|nr:hypothetical protein [Nitrososphaerales archaeon]